MKKIVLFLIIAMFGFCTDSFAWRQNQYIAIMFRDSSAAASRADSATHLYLLDTYIIDSLRATGANIDTITLMRLNITGAINGIATTATLDSIRATGANIDTITVKRVVATGTLKAAYLEATANVSATGNIISQDSVRAPSLDGDTLWSIKAIETQLTNSVFVGKVAFPAGKCSTVVYVKGARKNDVVVANFQMNPDSVYSKNYADSTWVMVRPVTDTLRFYLGGSRTGKAAGSDSVAYIRIGIK